MAEQAGDRANINAVGNHRRCGEVAAVMEPQRRRQTGAGECALELAVEQARLQRSANVYWSHE